MKTIDYNGFDLIMFPDANVILECEPLAKLHWNEVGDGRKLMMITPTVLKQVDAKKHDGRLGRIARDFRRLLEPLLRQEVVRVANIEIELAPRMPLKKNFELDSADSDQRILLEMLSCGAPLERIIFVSGDMQPVVDAQQLGVKGYLTPSSWLRAPEPTNHERRVQRLEQELAAIKQTEPKLEVELEFESEIIEPLLAVAPWTEEQRIQALARLIERHKRPDKQERKLGRSFAVIELNEPDYEEHRKRLAPATIATFPRWLQEQYGQRAFRLVVRNSGHVRAARVKIDLTNTTGWISDRPIWFDIDPTPPFRDTFSRLLPDNFGPLRAHYGPHDFFPESPPDRRNVVSWSCEDFRHGEEWSFSGYIYFEPADSEPHELCVRVTAANFHGKCEKVLSHPGGVKKVQIDQLVDLDEGQHRGPPPFIDIVQGALERDEMPRIETIDPRRKDG
jgi:hypothetical protein